MEINKLKKILEAVMLGADRVLTVIHMEGLFELDEERPTRDEIRQALHEMTEDYQSRGYELKQVASGFRLQVRQEYATWVGRLWEERPARYTRALLETMALIAYRQPITRGEIEEVRGVSVSSNIVKTLLERDWIKVLGHKDVPGKPTLYGTTKEFLDYFNLKSLDQLPTLAEIKDLDSIHPELALDDHEQVVAGDGQTDENNSDEQLPVQNDGVVDNEEAAIVETNNHETDEGELESMVTEVAEDISDAVPEDEGLADSSDDMLDSEKQVFNV
ncbi:MAG: SMC-Scp complex subunit ScpB [Gammaproteobacteria bacterium]|nr:MAG: SMC-Scp complex subunit ScpB [Gammaproteobacteria bacterium]